MRLRYRPFALWITTSTTARTSTTSAAAYHSSSLRAAFVGRTDAYAFSGRGFSSTKPNPILRGGAVPKLSHSFRKSSSDTAMSSSSSLTRAGADQKEAKMADSLRVALCQFPVTEDKDTNHETAQTFVERAAGEGAELVILPEIWNSPYATAAFPEYAEVLPGVGGDAEEGTAASLEDAPSAALLRGLSVDNRLWIVGGSIPELEQDGRIYNTCLVFDPEGRIVAKHRKVHLFDVDVPGGITFFESDTLSSGGSLTHFDTPAWGRIGVGICYDIRFPEYAMLLAQERGCRILVYPGAFNLTTGPAHWELLQRGRALDNQCYVLTCSPARSPEPEQPGRYPHYSAWGHSTAVSPWGDVIATTDEKEGVVVVDLDLTKIDGVRGSIPIRKQKRRDLYKVVEQV